MNVHFDEQLLAAANRIHAAAPGETGSAFRRLALRREVTRLASSAAALAWLRDNGATSGWLECRSRQRLFHDGVPAADARSGHLLAAEAVAASPDGAVRFTSLAACHAGSHWVGLRWREDEEGEHFLADDITLLATDGSELHYWRLWARREGFTGLVQVHSILHGVTPPGNSP